MKFLTLALFLFSFSAGAASERFMSCKGKGTAQDFETFRLNILKVSEGQFKAVLLEGFTTQNSSETWKVTIAQGGSEMFISNVNKTKLVIQANLESEAVVDDLKGFEATMSAVYIARPAYSEPVEYKIKGKMACVLGRN